MGRHLWGALGTQFSTGVQMGSSGTVTPYSYMRGHQGGCHGEVWFCGLYVRVGRSTDDSGDWGSNTGTWWTPA